MNIIELHERVRFWVDIVSSTRFESEDIDNALNISIDNKKRESYDQNRPINRSDAFQRIQRIRDELGPLVKKLNISDGLSIEYVSEETLNNQDVVQFKQKVSLTSSILNYGYLLSFRIKDATNNNWINVNPTTFDRKNINSKNPYRRVIGKVVNNNYYYEEDGYWIIETEFGDNLISDVEIYYLAQPQIVKYGIERNNNYTFTNTTNVIAVEETVYSGTTYSIGTKFIISNGTKITSGLVVSDFVECDIRQTAHEEISRRAAINCLLVAGQAEKAKLLREEITAS